MYNAANYSMKYPVNPVPVNSFSSKEIVGSSFSSKMTTFQFIHIYEYREHHSYRVHVKSGSKIIFKKSIFDSNKSPSKLFRIRIIVCFYFHFEQKSKINLTMTIQL